MNTSCPSCFRDVPPDTRQCPWCGATFGFGDAETLPIPDEGFLPQEGDELRQEERMPLMCEVIYATKDDLDKSYLYDLSMGGLFIESKNPPSKGESVHLKIYLPGEEQGLDVWGVVAWSSKEERITPERTYPPGMGVRFTKISTEDHIKLGLNILKEYK